MSEERVRAVIESISSTFSRLDIDAWLSNFHQPSLMVSATGSLPLADPNLVASALAPMLETLRDQDFDHSQVDECHVRMLTPSTALASAVFTRLAGDQVLETIAATYILAEREDRWGVVLVTGHPPDSLPIP
jgi:NTF2-like protein (DUF6841)